MVSYLYSGFSGTMPLESIVFSGFNFYLGLPIIAIGMYMCMYMCIYMYMDDVYVRMVYIEYM